MGSIKCYQKCFISLVVFIVFYQKWTTAIQVQPIILGKNATIDIILNAADNYNITCQGAHPLEWIYPKMDERNQGKHQWTTFRINDTEMPDNILYPYRSVLYITNISYPFVGYYTCQYKNGKNNEDNDQVYIYVKDSTHLSVEDEYKVHFAVQYEETTIPCRPTSPDIDVKLESLGSAIIENELFSPKLGFTFTVNDLSFQDYYKCTFTSNSKDEESQVILIELNIINSPRNSLAKPFIKDMSQNHTDVGETLTLQCQLQEESTNVAFEWKTPRGIFKIPPSKKIIDRKKLLVSELSIKNTLPSDAGEYTCTVKDRQNHSNSFETLIMIHDTNNCFIQINEENNQNHIEVYAGQDVQWVLDIYAHPKPEITWYFNNIKLENNTKYQIEYLSERTVIFKINNATLDDDGLYNIKGKSYRNKQKSGGCLKQASFALRLDVECAPTVNLEPREIYIYNETGKVQCKVRGNPLPQISWEYEPCLNETCQIIEGNQNNEQFIGKFEKVSTINLNTTKDGIIKCYAGNSWATRSASAKYYISDIKNGFTFDNFGNEAIIETKHDLTFVTIAKDHQLTFTCAVSLKKSEELHIRFNNLPLNLNSQRILVEQLSTNLSRKVIVTIQQATLEDAGLYSCEIKNTNNGKIEELSARFKIESEQSPKIWATNLDETIEIDYPKMPYKLYCNYTAIPKAQVYWFKDTDMINPSDRIILENDGRTLKFIQTELSDEGKYKCDIFNSIGQDFRIAQMKFKVKPVSIAIYVIITILIGILLVFAIIYILIKKRKEQALKRELKALGLENFHKGNPENLNPELGIDDQVELLPYNKEWEFPTEQLKLVKQLGSGAFGVVMKGEAKRIIDGEEKTIVAVKMVKKNADESYIKALASELKILIHLGKHINVVNLLGACTKNVAKRELFVIVEFCRYGNLQNYLFKHRSTFINQVDPKSGKVDYNIGSDVLERTYSVCSDPGTITRSYSDYRGKDNSALISSAATQTTSLGDDHVTLSNNSTTQQPEWRTNYRGDYKGDVKPVCTRDLITWSFQVARGMEYLASRKVLHGDLAARNILLADENIVKICDFGLAKTMYNDNNYKKKGNSPLPIKWMAVESIRDRVFSTQSDVWSFGIVLWELFSLARVPYPGMEADEKLYHKLVEGYRMESPDYAPKDMYTLMVNCWNARPLARPTFTGITESIGSFLEESVRKHYVDLNDPYLAINTQKLKENDYLAMLTPPSFDVLSSPTPHYVNDCVKLPSNDENNGTKNNDGYTFMGANSIFSPRLQDEDIFTFNTGRKKSEHNENGNHELRPMLYATNNGDSDTENGYLTPITPVNSISNPSYNYPPQIRNENILTKTPDNYVNFPQYKNLLNSKFNENNKTEEIGIHQDGGGRKERVHYVNSDSGIWDSVEV